MGFMPPRDEFNHYIEVAEKVLKTECKTILDHLHVVHAGFFLARILMRMMSEHGERVDLEFIRRKVELDKKYPYIFPESPSVAIQVNQVSSEFALSDYPITLSSEPESIHISSESVLSDYPITLPARAFKSTEVMNLPCVSVQKTELIEYLHRPELL